MELGKSKISEFDRKGKMRMTIKIIGSLFWLVLGVAEILLFHLVFGWDLTLSIALTAFGMACVALSRD